MTKKSLVSIIIPCYNYAYFLEDAVGSVIAQVFTNWECLIIDDGSTDNTKEVASKLVQKDYRIKYFYQENMGLAATRNRGFALSKGDYIQFLDADDMIHPCKLEEQVNILDNDTSIGVSYTNYQKFEISLSNLTGRYSFLRLGDNPLEDLLYKWERGLSIPIHSALFRRSVFKESKRPFVDDLKAKEDWVMWIKLASDKVKFSFLDKDYCFYRTHTTNQTLEFNYMFIYFIRAVLNIIKIIPSEYHEKFINSAINHAELFYLNFISVATLFYDQGKGFLSENTLSQTIRIHSEFTFSIKYNLSNVGLVKQIRFDPFENYWSSIKLAHVKYKTKKGEIIWLDLKNIFSNGNKSNDGFIQFYTFDPMFIFPIADELQQIEITGKANIFDLQQIEEAKNIFIQELKSKQLLIENKQLLIENKQLLIEEVLNSRSWKITAPLRLAGRAVKKIFNWIGK
jgi:glycosyltransferase involved in cell wall biosynthesis